MDISEQLLKRRIAALLPKRSGQPTVRNGHPADGVARTQTVDVSDLSAIANDERFLKESYRRILGRECDLPGLVNCLELLQRHVPRRTILLQLINSEEAKARGIRFTGLDAILSPAHGRRGFFSIRDAAGRLGAIVRDLIRRILFARFDSIDHRLNFLLREFASRTDSLAAKTDQSLWSLSEKLDAYVANLSEGQRAHREELALQAARVRDLHASAESGRTVLTSVDLLTRALQRDLSIQSAQIREMHLAAESIRMLLANVDLQAQGLQRELSTQVIRLDRLTSVLRADLGEISA